MFINPKITKSTKSFSVQIDRLKKLLEESECIVIGAGSGLSTAAGYFYDSERLEKYFSDFQEKYGFENMYFGGFTRFESSEEFWAYWSRYVYINRYIDPPKNTYKNLFELVKDKDYFVLTTNVDHCFQKAGFDKERLFYTQGDYGLFQCSKPCCKKTYDNEQTIRKMVLSQGYEILPDGSLALPKGAKAGMKVPSELIPRCPVCGRPMTMNLRSDDKFVEDEGWFKASKRYSDFIKRNDSKKILFLELGVGYNTPVIIKIPFWQMTAENENAHYACINFGDATTLEEIAGRSVCIDEDIDAVIQNLKK